MRHDGRAFERLLDGIDAGHIYRGSDFSYHRVRTAANLDDLLYAAVDRGWVELLDDGRGTPEVTTAGRKWRDNRPRRAERLPTTEPQFVEAVRG